MPLTIVSREALIDAVGQQREPTPWISIQQPRITGFAEITEDFQPIHIDEEVGKQTPWGCTIAHGMLTLSMIAKMAEEFALVPEGATMGLNYGFDKVRFIEAVPVNSRIRGRATITDVTDKGHQILIRYSVTMEIENIEKPAVVCDWLAMFVMSAA